MKTWRHGLRPTKAQTHIRCSSGRVRANRPRRQTEGVHPPGNFGERRKVPDVPAVRKRMPARVGYGRRGCCEVDSPLRKLTLDPYTTNAKTFEKKGLCRYHGKLST